MTFNTEVHGTDTRKTVEAAYMHQGCIGTDHVIIIDEPFMDGFKVIHDGIASRVGVHEPTTMDAVVQWATVELHRRHVERLSYAG